MKFFKNVGQRRAKNLSKSWQRLVEAKAKFPIDIVVLWVEDNADHRKARENASQKQGFSKFGFDNQNTRFTDNSELRWCLRSIFWCVPWVTTVHVVVADYQFPEKYIDRALLSNTGIGPQVRVVHHREFMPSPCLPTFNSQAIEARIHLIPGLADHFIYCNDDFAFGKPLAPSYFFKIEDGSPRYNLEESYVVDRPKTKNMSKHAMAWINNCRVLDELTEHGQRVLRRYPCHVAVPMLKPSFREVWGLPEVSPLLRATVASKFRKSSNLYIIGFLVYWNLVHHGASRRDHSGCFFHDLETGDDVKGLVRFLCTRTPQLICVNDNLFLPRELKTVQAGWRALFPLPSPWEPPGSTLRESNIMDKNNTKECLNQDPRPTEASGSSRDLTSCAS